MEKEKIKKIEEKLGRNKINKNKLNEEEKFKKSKKMLKYLFIASNMTYTLISPILLMMIIYYCLEKYVVKGKNSLLLLILIILGIITGYWSLIKELKKINNMK